MRCFEHPDREANSACTNCGKGMCPTCQSMTTQKQVGGHYHTQRYRHYRAHHTRRVCVEPPHTVTLCPNCQISELERRFTEIGTRQMSFPLWPSVILAVVLGIICAVIFLPLAILGLIAGFVVPYIIKRSMHKSRIQYESNLLLQKIDDIKRNLGREI